MSSSSSPVKADFQVTETRVSTELDFLTSAIDDNEKYRILDEREMRAQGKSPDLTRRFTFYSITAMAMVEMSSWASMLTLDQTQLASGGAPSLIWGFFVSWIGVLAVTASLAELCSIAPVAAGQYHNVWMLAPNRVKKFLSWYTGVLSTLGWTIAAASTLVACGQLTQSVIKLANPSHPDLVLDRAYATLFTLAFLVIIYLVNAIMVRWLPEFAKAALTLMFCSFVVCMAVLGVYAEKRPTSVVFSGLVDTTGWPTDGLAFMVGLLGSNLCMLGSDGPTHLAEEVQNAAVAVPRAMVWSVIFSGILGFSACIMLAYTIDPAQNTPFSFNFLALFKSFGGQSGAMAAMAVLIALMCCMTVLYVAAAARQARAFSRDNGLPWSSYFRTLNHDASKTNAPLRCVTLVTIVTVLIILLNLASPAALNALASLVIVCLMASLVVPIGLLMVGRLRDEPRTWGRWRMNLFGRQVPGMGVAVNIFAVAFLTVSIMFSLFPSVLPVTLDTMNWAPVVWAVVTGMAVAYWVVSARKKYKGVVHETDVFAVPFAV